MIELVYSDSELISAINDRVAAERALRKINAYNEYVPILGYIIGEILTLESMARSRGLELPKENADDNR